MDSISQTRKFELRRTSIKAILSVINSIIVHQQVINTGDSSHYVIHAQVVGRAKFDRAGIVPISPCKVKVELHLRKPSTATRSAGH